MDSYTLPIGWSAGPPVPHDQLNSDPPASADSTYVQFFGATSDGYRLFIIPAATPIADVVRFFEVGSHGAESYGFDSEETVNLVAAKASMIADLVPCRVTLADSASLQLTFTRQITASEVSRIESFFNEEEVMQAGLDGYISEWDGEGQLLSSVLSQNQFNFWWD